MNALSYWIFLASGIFLYTSVALGVAPNAGWFDYVPLASRQFDPGHNIDFYCLGIIFNSIASTLTAGQFIVTIFKSRAPGMSFNRMPLFCFAMLAASAGLLFALPLLSADTIFLFLDRNVGTHFFDVAHGGSAYLWQHLFWMFGHPEVYILIVPAFGIATEIIPAFTQRRVTAFPLVAIAELLVVFIGFGVWAHHMYATGIPTITAIFFGSATAMVIIPSTIQVFAWCMTMVLGTARFKTPLLFIAGFIFMFVIGGLSGIMFVAIPFDQQVTDTYFVIAHFHYIIFGAAVFPIFGGMYYWFPKVTGKLYIEKPGQISFWLIFIGTNLLFFPMYIVGLLGMPREIYTYPGNLGWTPYNVAETVGGFLTAFGILVCLGNLVVSYFRGMPAGPDPWYGPTLEWATTSPPPEYNFAVIPTVTSAYPNWDVEDREEDAAKLADGVMVLDDGHEQPVSTTTDGIFSEIIEMPHSSPWPPILALCLGLIFTFLALEKFGIAGIFGAFALLSLLGWHSKEPQES
jgi:heme/copper-type cytochrome/quinol oxidase subunit 1